MQAMSGWSPNPYKSGAPVDDIHFTDRVEELAKLKAVMLNGQNLILIAPRRYGKSSLLIHAIDAVRAEGGRTGRVSLIKCASPREVAETLMKGVIDGPMGWLRGRSTEIAQRLRQVRLRPQLSISSETGMIDGVSFGTARVDEDWRQVIGDVIRSLNDLGEADKPVSLVIDEFQKAYEISPTIADVFKDLVDECPRVGLVFAGSKRHLMEAMTNDPHGGALYNVGTKVYLEKIPAADFIPYLLERAASAGSSLAPEVAQQVYDSAWGVPNDVQLIAFWSFQQAEGGAITASAVAAAIRGAVMDQAEDFVKVFDRLSLKQQLLLKMIARTDVRSVTAAAVLQEVGASHTALRKAAGSLQRAGLITREDGLWIVGSGLMRQWLINDYD